MTLKKVLVLIIVAWLFSSCKITNSLVELNRKRAKVYTYSLENKTLKYLPMHHLGKETFYNDVKNIVKEYKEKGYVVYYELITTNFTEDSLLKDTIRRKVRKIKGFSGSYHENAEGSFAEKYVEQPDYPDLGIDSSDVRADVNYLEFIQEWEKQNGKIVLDSIDFNTPFDKAFEKRVDYSKKEYKAIVIEYRNARLIDMILNSPDNKILILYGKGHQHDFKKQLKQAAS